MIALQKSVIIYFSSKQLYFKMYVSVDIFTQELCLHMNINIFRQ